jgi:branched-chain amino acid transport system ATP-binding protein
MSAQPLAAGASLLRVESLRKAFGGVRAVDDVSFELGAGELLALIGPNGAGKSTCFNCINGQLRPDHGRVLLGGTDLVRRASATSWSGWSSGWSTSAASACCSPSTAWTWCSSMPTGSSCWPAAA